MSLKLFKFTAENTRTAERAAFLGQGERMEDAFKDAVSNIGAPFRPSSSGGKRPEHGMAVTLKDGATVSRTLREFEGDIPFGTSTPAPATPEILDL